MITSLFFLLVAGGLIALSVVLFLVTKNKTEPNPVVATVFILSLPFFLCGFLSIFTNGLSTAEIAVSSPETALQHSAANLALDLRETSADRTVKYSEANKNNAEADKFGSEAVLYDAQAEAVRVDTGIKIDDHTAEYAGKFYVFLLHNPWLLVGVLASLLVVRYWPRKQKSES